MSSNKLLSWNDRFALIDHFKPADTAVCAAFGVDQSELETARQLRASGTFIANNQLDMSKYATVFTVSAPSSTVTPAAVATGTVVKTSKGSTAVKATKGSATVHTKPESATKKAVVKVAAKRGRKGDKITRALQAVTTTPVAVDAFIKQHGISLAVLRQSKRFLDKMETTVAKQICTINVRQNKTTKSLEIWRENV